jgi:hypothetical protein
VPGPEVYLQDTGTIKGRGVYARRDFAEGEVIEECAVILFHTPFFMVPAEIKNVVFNWGVLARTTESSALALGYGSLYNHGEPANMRYMANPQAGTLLYIAARAIKADEELTINYNAIGGGATWGDNNWFDRMQLRPLGPT